MPFQKKNTSPGHNHYFLLKDWKLYAWYCFCYQWYHFFLPAQLFNKNFPNQIFSQTKAVNFLKQFFTQTKTVTFLIHEVENFWWVGHICLISFPVVVRKDDGTQSTLLVEFCYWVRHINLTSLNYADQSTMTIHFFFLKQLFRKWIVHLLQLFFWARFSCEPGTSPWKCFQL